MFFILLVQLFNIILTFALLFSVSFQGFDTDDLYYWSFRLLKCPI